MNAVVDTAQNLTPGLEQIYSGYFGLKEKPFSITPDPRFLYMSPRHREALAHLLFSVKQGGGGFVQLTGEVGTGKTTLTRALLQQLPDRVNLALIFNPRQSPLEFVRSICDELHVPYEPGTDSLKALTDALNAFLLDAHRKGRRTLVLIDEAQNLEADVLEQIRLLTNLETATDKLLQIILVGQPELRVLLDRKELRQLAQRVTARYHLLPLSSDETGELIKYRLAVAGNSQHLFTASAVRHVYRVTGGIPRLINVICDRALLGAYALNVRRIDQHIVMRAAAEVSGAQSPRPAFWPVWIAVAVAVVAATAIALRFFGVW